MMISFQPLGEFVVQAVDTLGVPLAIGCWAVLQAFLWHETPRCTK